MKEGITNKCSWNTEVWTTMGSFLEDFEEVVLTLSILEIKSYNYLYYLKKKKKKITHSVNCKNYHKKSGIKAN